MITLIGNLKGGTGKSAVTFNLAVLLAAKKKSVTVFDLELQATFNCRRVHETDEAAYAIKSLNGLAGFEIKVESKAATEVNQLATILYSPLFIVDGVH